jgi:sugar lactone lactonase YvrE
MIKLHSSFRTLAGIAHAEGIATGPDGKLWAGGEAGQIYCIDPETGSSREVVNTHAWILGLCVDAASHVYACAYDRGSILRVDPESGRVVVYCGEAGGQPLRGPNWPVFTSDGSLLVSVSGSEDLKDCDGQVVRIPPGGGPAEFLDIRPLHYSNGLALAPDGTLFIVESFTPRVLSFCNGSVRNYVELTNAVPDGLALDEEGGLIVSCFQPNRVLRVPPGGGDPEILLDDWTGQKLLTPTNVAFYGRDRRSLAIASLCGWRISTVDLPWRGMPLNYPSIPR